MRDQMSFLLREWAGNSSFKGMTADRPPRNDAELKEALTKLFGDWKKDVDEPLKTDFSEDGALPGYFAQKYKILSIGRESHSKTPSLVKLVEYLMREKEYNIEELKKLILLGHPERNGFDCWKLAARIVYGLPHEENWDGIPENEELTDLFKDGEFSFAVMNASKYANPKGPKPSDDFFKYVKVSLGDNNSGRNFTREEIELLNPDLIFTWNLRARLKSDKNNKDEDKDKAFKKLFTESPEGPEKLDNSCGFLADRAWVYKFDDGREIPLFDTWHLSIDYRSKKDPQKDIYDPLMRAFNSDIVQNLIARKKARDEEKLRAFSHL